LTATDENAPPQSAYATPEDAQLTGVSGHSMVLVVALHDLPEPCADLTRTMMFPVLKLCLYDVELRNHPLLRGEAPDIKSSAAREISAKVRESQKREGLGFSLAYFLPDFATPDRPFQPWRCGLPADSVAIRSQRRRVACAYYQGQSLVSSRASP
jgi:hypothetical protein